MADAFAVELSKAPDNAEALVIEINSPGGDIQPGLDIIWLIENVSVPTVCIVDGDASSMAAQISQACTTRVITKRSSFMIHEPTWGLQVMGQPNDWKNVAGSIEAQTKAMCESFARRMHIDPAAIRDRIEGAKYWEMNWREAWEWGAFDEVVDRASDVKDSLRATGKMPPNLAAGIQQHPQAGAAK